MRLLSRIVDWLFPKEAHKPITGSLNRDAVGKHSDNWKPPKD